MRKIEIDCRNISSPEALQTYVQHVMNFPDWYGRNLDALHDMLTEISSPVTITVITGADINAEMRTYLERFLRVLNDSEKENEFLTVNWIEK